MTRGDRFFAGLERLQILRVDFQCPLARWVVEGLPELAGHVTVLLREREAAQQQDCYEGQGYSSG